MDRAANDAACICSRGLYWVPAPVKSCVYCTTGPLLRTAPSVEEEKAKCQQGKSLHQTKFVALVTKHWLSSWRQPRLKHLQLTMGNWLISESQPVTTNRFWPLHTTVVCFCYILMPVDKALCRSHTPGVLLKKKEAKQENGQKCPQCIRSNSRTHIKHTDIGTSSCLSTLLLFLGRGCGSFHAKHGLEACGTPVNPLTAFVILQKGEGSTTHNTARAS